MDQQVMDMSETDVLILSYYVLVLYIMYYVMFYHYSHIILKPWHHERLFHSAGLLSAAKVTSLGSDYCHHKHEVEISMYYFLT